MRTGKTSTVNPGRTVALYNELHELARRKGPDAKLPTVREISASTGASSATIHAVLADLESHNIICKRRGSGIYVSPKINQKTIVVLLESAFFETPSISPFWGILQGLITKEAQVRRAARNEEFIFYLVTGTEREANSAVVDILARMRDSGRIHGILSIGIPAIEGTWLESLGVPTVCYAAEGAWYVQENIPALTQLAVAQLHEQGCRRLGQWWPVPPYRERVDLTNNTGFIDALDHLGLPYRPELTRDYLHTAGDSAADEAETPGAPEPLSYQEQGYITAMRVFGDPSAPKPDGVQIGDDMMTHGALCVFAKLGLEVGKDVHIASHANKGAPTLFGHEDVLILIETDPADIVRGMLSILDSLMAGEIPSISAALVSPRARKPAPYEFTIAYS